MRVSYGCPLACKDPAIRSFHRVAALTLVLLVAAPVAAFAQSADPTADLAGSNTSGSSVGSVSGNFNDHDEIASVHQEAVYALVDEGVVEGCEDDLYCPDPDISREQMASFIARALDLPADTTERFNDVQPGSTHGGNIGALAQAGVTQGCDDEGNFCPRDSVTREQMASFIQRAYELVADGPPAFDDVGSGGEHSEGISAISAAAVTDGCENNLYCPDDSVTREQMASFIARTMGITFDEVSGSVCPATTGPMTAPVHDHGVAAERFPVNRAALVGDQLHAFTIDLEPSRIAVDNVGADGSLATGDVADNLEVPTGRRTWAAEVVDDTLYFGQDFVSGSDSRELYELGPSGSPQLLTSVPGTEFWDIASDADGRLYLGTNQSQTIYRYDPASDSLDELNFSGTGTNGQVTQLDYDEDTDTLYVGTGRFTSSDDGSTSGRLLTVSEVSTWEPSSARNAEELLPAALDDVDSIVPGVYSLAVSDGVVAVGFETTDARLTVLSVDDEGNHQVRDDVTLDGENTIESVVIDPDEQTVFAAGSTTGAIYRSTNTGVSPASAELTEVVTPVAGAVNRDMFMVGGQLIGVAATGHIWSVDPDTGEHGPGSPRDLTTAGAETGAQLPQSLTVGNGYAAVGINNALALHTTGTTQRETVPAPGEAKTMTTVGDQLYAGMYSSGLLLRQPLQTSGGTFEAGVVEGTWGGEYGRPRDIHHDDSASRMLIGSRAQSNSDNVLLDYAVPSVGDSWPEPTMTESPVGDDQEVFAVSSYQGSAILGGAVTNGGQAQVVSRPVDGGQIEWSTSVGSSSVQSLETAGNQVHGLTDDGDWFVLDAASGDLEYRRQVMGSAEALAVDGDWLYAVDGDCLVAIDTERRRAETLQTGLDAETFGDHVVATDPDTPSGYGDVYAMSDSNLIRVRHTQR